MTVLVLIAITLVGVAATIVALTQRPAAQALMLSVFGLTLTVLFVVLQAPDVALSQLVIGAVVVPLLNAAVGLEVACGMSVLLAQFLAQEITIGKKGESG